MSLARFFAPNRCALSFELFPPKTAEAMTQLRDTVERLAQFKPDFFTCTYGAGGSSQSTTLDVLSMVREVTDLPVASHLTCVGATTEQLIQYMTEAKRRGADYIVALRGDPPRGTTEFVQVEGGLRYANELVSLIRQRFDDEFGVIVAGYPEVHQEATCADSDMENLKRKVDAGADVIVTQLFFDNSDFYRFRDRCEAAGITIPIVPGLLPVTQFAQAQRIALMCKAGIPDSLAAKMQQDESADWQLRVGIDHATEQVMDLLAHGIPGLHFYVLNRYEATAKVLEAING